MAGSWRGGETVAHMTGVADSAQSIPGMIIEAARTEGVGFFFRGWTAAW